MSAEILHSSRGGRVLLLDGQKFYSRLTTPKKSYWKCAQRNCPATAITREYANGVVDVIKETSHDHIAAHSKYVDDEADKELICFLNEICVNLLDNYFTLSKYEWELLNNFEATVRFLADECESWRIKKKSLLEKPTDPFLS
ncbi:Phosphoribosylaminoimidazole-succinocarboxamide synthase, partial [Frankliniella fusca]